MRCCWCSPRTTTTRPITSATTPTSSSRCSAVSPDALPRLRKAGRLQGRSLVLRDVVPADAEFIVGLRTDERKSRHLSATSPDVQRQRDWLAAYAGREGE